MNDRGKEKEERGNSHIEGNIKIDWLIDEEEARKIQRTEKTRDGEKKKRKWKGYRVWMSEWVN